MERKQLCGKSTTQPQKLTFVCIPNTPIMINVNNISKSFGLKKVLSDLSFTVAPGEVLGFLGPNGAGKSTTMKIITGFIEADSGSVDIFGHDIKRDALAAKTQIGYLPEGAPAYDDMTCYEYLRFIAAIRNIARAERAAAIDVVVAQLQLEEVLHQRIETLSKGFKRRVGLAQALIHQPRVLILDEPTDGLDPNQKHQVRELITNLSRDKIIIISTHILEEVSALCTRALIIARGVILKNATPSDLLAESRYHGAVVLVLPEAQDIRAQLEALPEVSAVEADADGKRFIAIAKPGQDALGAVRALCDKRKVPLRSLFTEPGRLDEVFRTITQSAA